MGPVFPRPLESLRSNLKIFGVTLFGFSKSNAAIRFLDIPS